KRDVYSATEERTASLALLPGGSKFDPEQVEALRKVLLQTLKNASNIRNLKPEDFVAFTVFGQPANVVQVKKSRSKGGSNVSQPAAATPSAEGNAKGKTATETARAEQKAQAAAVARSSDLLRNPTQGTVLSLRVRKADVDAFASGKLDFDSFAKRA